MSKKKYESHSGELGFTEIAKKLNISPQLCKYYYEQAMKKLNKLQ